MGYEVDYLSSGDGGRSADAISLRYGDLLGTPRQQTVITIDGGTVESGEAIVEHIRKHYGTDTVDTAILSHPDADHASGMRRILEELKVKQVVMHLPWNHSSAVKGLLDDKSVTEKSLRSKAKRNLSAAREIEQIAQNKGIPIFEAFAGSGNKTGLRVIGPSEQYYEELLCGFKFMPAIEAKPAAASVGELVRLFGEKIVNWIEEHWFTETLIDPADDATSPENNSSLIFLLELEDHRLLFTGDAGVPAIDAALDFADANQISLTNLNFFHVPHHGSRRNLGPTILNRLFGSTRLQDTPNWAAYISVSKDGAPKHPHKKVTNALRRRGAHVFQTGGRNILYRHNAPERFGYGPIEAIPFYGQVEDDD